MALARCVDEIRLSRAFEFAAACTDSGQVTRRARFDPLGCNHVARRTSRNSFTKASFVVSSIDIALAVPRFCDVQDTYAIVSQRRARKRSTTRHTNLAKRNDLDAEYRDRASRDTNQRNATGTHIALSPSSSTPRWQVTFTRPSARRGDSSRVRRRVLGDREERQKHVEQSQGILLSCSRRTVVSIREGDSPPNGPERLQRVVQRPRSSGSGTGKTCPSAAPLSCAGQLASLQTYSSAA